MQENAWMRIHKPKNYKQFSLSDFDKLLMKSGQEVEIFVRGLFPEATFINVRDAIAQATTLSYIETKQSVHF